MKRKDIKNRLVSIQYLPHLTVTFHLIFPLKLNAKSLTVRKAVIIIQLSMNQKTI